MSQVRTDEERVLKLIERVRLLIAIDDELPTETKLNTQPMLKLLEAAVSEGNPADRARVSGYYEYLYAELSANEDIEALLSAMRVFLPHL